MVTFPTPILCPVDLAVDLAVFGSTTHQMIRGAGCPVLAVHPEQSPDLHRS
jgi:hypothetical protein